MTKERRNSNKQTTVESLDKKLDEAIAERIVLADAVEEIHQKVNFDGGLVYQCDLRELKEDNTEQHNSIVEGSNKRFDAIDEKLELIFPVVKEQIDEAQAYKLIADRWGFKVKSAGFWIKIFVGLGIVTSVIVIAADTIMKYLKIGFFK